MVPPPPIPPRHPGLRAQQPYERPFTPPPRRHSAPREDSPSSIYSRSYGGRPYDQSRSPHRPSPLRPSHADNQEYVDPRAHWPADWREQARAGTFPPPRTFLDSLYDVGYDHEGRRAAATANDERPISGYTFGGAGPTAFRDDPLDRGLLNRSPVSSIHSDPEIRPGSQDGRYSFDGSLAGPPSVGEPPMYRFPYAAGHSPPTQWALVMANAYGRPPSFLPPQDELPASAPPHVEATPQRRMPIVEPNRHPPRDGIHAPLPDPEHPPQDPFTPDNNVSSDFSDTTAPPRRRRRKHRRPNPTPGPGASAALGALYGRNRAHSPQRRHGSHRHGNGRRHSSPEHRVERSDSLRGLLSDLGRSLSKRK